MAMLSGRFGGAVVRTHVSESLADAVLDRMANSAPATSAPRRKRRLTVISLAPPVLGTYRVSGEECDLQVPSPTTSADDVSQTTAKHEKAAKGERIAADDPLDVLSRQTESSLHRGQRHIDDCEVQDQHELRRAKQREYQIRAMSLMPATSFVVGL